MTKRLHLIGKKSNGLVCTVDDEDYLRCKKYYWWMNGEYVVTQINGKIIPLQNFILNYYEPNKIVDHIDLNKLHNCKSNLRPATHQQNNMNKPMMKGNKSGYKGVTKRGEKYIARIYYDSKEISLGTFKYPEAAAVAYDEAAIKYFGEFCRTNFPRSLYD